MIGLVDGLEKSWVLPENLERSQEKHGKRKSAFGFFIYIYIYILVYNMYNYIFTICIYIYMFASDTICFAVSEVLLAYFLKFLLSDSHQGSTISFTECSNSEVKHKKDVGGGFNISLIFIPIIFGR